MKSAFIPYCKKDNKIFIMLMIPSDPKYGGDQPQLCKGNIDKNEIPIDAAVREAEEELGLKKENLKNIEYFKTASNINIFYGEVCDMNDFNEPHYETGETMWIDSSQIYIVRDWQKPIIRDFFKVVDAF